MLLVTLLLMLPRPVSQTSSRVLEFDSLRDLLRGYASSPLGQGLIADLEPSTDREWIENQQQLTTEIREFRRVGGRFDFSGLLDVTKLVEKSRIAGAALETTDIRDVVLMVDRSAEWREIVLNPPAAMKFEWKAVSQLSAGIADFTDTLRAFRNKILPDGTLDDKASPELSRIRREIEKQRRSIQESSARLFAPLIRRWRGTGRTCHHSRGALCDPRKGRAETASAGRGARCQLERPDGFRRTT